MDEALGTAVQQVGQLTQLGTAGLCLAALLYTYMRVIPRLHAQLARRGREVRALYQAMLTEEQRKAIMESEAGLESRKHNGEES